jgi:hypothetical protein
LKVASESVPWRELSQLIARDPARRGIVGLADSSFASGEALRDAATSLAEAKKVGIVTGFCIPDAPQPAAETDGPPGAVYLAHALAELGIAPLLITDAFGLPLVEAACDARGLPREFVVPFPFEPLGSRERNAPHLSATTDRWIEEFERGAGKGLTHLVTIERCGPSHTRASLATQGCGAAEIEQFEREVSPEHRDACHNMRGIDITAFTAKTHLLVERSAQLGISSIGVGDGGNELGMGRIPWSQLCSAITFGPACQIACRVPTDHLLVCGVSNWGGYALALALARLRGETEKLRAADVESERALIEHVVRETAAVDGVTRLREATVDGLPLETYLQILGGLRRAIGLTP